MLHRPHTRIAIAVLTALVLAVALVLCGQGPAASQDEPAWGIAVHGGAGAIERGRLTPAREAEYRAALTAALRAGHAVLDRGGPALDAVQAAIRVLEDSPLFNAGRGAVLTAAGTRELDASLMDGRTLAAGAVAGVRRVRNPVDLARLVMEESPHVLLVGDGAEAFAVERGMSLVPESYFAASALPPSAPDARLGTVGAVALDRSGTLAAGTSTGGTSGKRPGRVGDSPLIGAGTYADDGCGAVSATGHGEYFIRAVVAHDICAIARYEGIPLRDAADQVVMEKLVRMGGAGGVIALDPSGAPSFSFNTPGMFRGYLGREGEPMVEMYR